MSLQLAPISGPLPAETTGSDAGVVARSHRVPAAEPATDLARARHGDREAFARLVRLHQARIFSVALRLCGRREDAEELAQDAFVQLHAALPQIQDEGHLLHWLLRAVTHRSFDRVRARVRQPRLVPLEVAGENAAAQADDPLSARRLQAMLQLLPVPARAVVLLRYQEDLDPADNASVLDMPINTVKSHLRRSLEWLRARHGGDRDGN